VLLVSEAAGALCEHMENALVHKVGDLQELTSHINLLDQDRSLLNKLRTASLKTCRSDNMVTAGDRLHRIYLEALTKSASSS